MTKQAYGQSIRQARLSAGLSQEALAAKMGVEQEQISRWEKDRLRPTSASLMKLADALNCSIDVLVGRESQYTHVASASDEGGAA